MAMYKISFVHVVYSVEFHMISVLGDNCNGNVQNQHEPACKTVLLLSFLNRSIHKKHLCVCVNYLIVLSKCIIIFTGLTFPY